MAKRHCKTVVPKAVVEKADAIPDALSKHIQAQQDLAGQIDVMLLCAIHALRGEADPGDVAGALAAIRSAHTGPLLEALDSVTIGKVLRGGQ